MKNIFVLLFLVMFSSLESNAQFTVTASITGTVSNDNSSCSDRIITTNVSGGIGPYLYSYSKSYGQPGPEITTVNMPYYVINPQPALKTEYVVFVRDYATGKTESAIVTAFQKPINDFSNQFWPNVFTPNNDGKNDVFYPILPSDRDINALVGVFRAKLEVANSSGAVFLNLDINHPNQNEFPIKYSDIKWNGRVNNVGGAAVPGTYYFTLTLYNCNFPDGKQFKKYTTLIL